MKEPRESVLDPHSIPIHLHKVPKNSFLLCNSKFYFHLDTMLYWQSRTGSVFCRNISFKNFSQINFSKCFFWKMCFPISTHVTCAISPQFWFPLHLINQSRKRKISIVRYQHMYGYEVFEFNIQTWNYCYAHWQFLFDRW